MKIHSLLTIIPRYYVGLNLRSFPFLAIFSSHLPCPSSKKGKTHKGEERKIVSYRIRVSKAATFHDKQRHTLVWCFPFKANNFYPETPPTQCGNYSADPFSPPLVPVCPASKAFVLEMLAFLSSIVYTRVAKQPKNCSNIFQATGRGSWRDKRNVSRARSQISVIIILLLFCDY